VDGHEGIVPDGAIGFQKKGGAAERQNQGERTCHDTRTGRSGDIVRMSRNDSIGHKRGKKNSKGGGKKR